jgi:hypothetical protein
MAIGEVLKMGFNAWGKAKEAKENQKAAERDKERQFKVLESMDFEPVYASATTPTYQRTESPIARSYLESFLLGNNPDATFSGAPNAKATRAGQQYQQNAMFGTPEQRVARAQQIQTETPWWKVTPPTQPVVTQKMKDSSFTARYPEIAKLGIDTEEKYQKALAAGLFESASADTRPDELSPMDLFGYTKDNKNQKSRKRLQSKLEEVLGGEA